MSIIQSGLILNLDAGNTSSYPRTGTIWKDLSGNNNNGTLINGPTFDSANNGSIVFDGVNKYVDLGNILDYTSGNFSFSYWVNFNSLTTNQGGQGPIVIFKGNYHTNGYYDQISTTGNIIFVTNQSGVNQGTSTNSGVIAPGNWYNIAYSRNGSSVRIYLNGNDITQTAGTHINPLPSGDNFRLANYANGYIYGNFKLSNLLSYNRNLTATEVLQNYNATKGRYDTTPDCEIIAGGTEVFPNSGTTTFTTLYESTCAGGAVSDGPTTGMTITKVGKNGIDTYLITAIPSKGSIFKGWNQNKQTTGLITKKYVIASTQLSVNFMISDNTTWFAIFDKDCSYIDIPFCFSTNKDNLCLSCNEQKTVYFNNINNQFINNGSNISTSTWFSSANFESLITYDRSVGGVRVGWSFNLSSQELSGGGTFKEEKLDDYDPGCNRSVGTKMVTLECQPTGQIKYFVYLYKNNVKIKTFDRTGYSLIRLFEHTGNSGDLTPVYKLKYSSVGNQSISFSVATNTTYNISTGGLFCFGGYEYYGTRFYTRPTTASVTSPDGYYTQLINGEYSNYNIIYRVYEGQVIQVLDCRSDILDCNG